VQCVALFETTRMALQFERACRACDIDVRIVPVPRRLSSSCGFACEYPCDVRARVAQIAREADIEVSAYHELDA